jgi:predicted DNA-binding transcriptional regulator AlpA
MVEFLSEDQAAEYLGFTPKALQAWRCNGRGPTYIRISSRAIRYRKNDIDNWLESRLVNSTKDVLKQKKEEENLISLADKLLSLIETIEARLDVIEKAIIKLEKGNKNEY